MRREERQHGWVYAYDRTLYGDAKNTTKELGAAPKVVVRKATAKGAFVRAPRKPTNHCKFTGGTKEKAYLLLGGDDDKGKKSCKKGRHNKFSSVKR